MKRKTFKKAVAMMLALIMSLACGAQAFAEDLTEANGSVEMPVSIIQEASLFSVTVPVGIGLTFDEYGNIVASEEDEPLIENYSCGPVVVKSLTVKTSTGWTFYDYNDGDNTKIMKEKAGSKYIGFAMQIGDETNEDAAYATGSGGPREVPEAEAPKTSYILYDSTSQEAGVAIDNGCHIPAATYTAGEDGAMVGTPGKATLLFDAIVSPHASGRTTQAINCIFVIDWDV